MCRNKTIVILGRGDRLEMAEFVFHFLIDEARRAWRSYRLNTNAAARESASFRAGVIEGFRSALKAAGSKSKHAARHSHSPEQHSMVACDESNSGLQQFVTSQFPRLRSQTVSASLASASAQREGAEVGRKIMLPRPVGAGVRSTVQLLRGSDN